MTLHYKAKVSSVTAVVVRRTVKLRRSNVFYIVVSQLSMRFSALRTGRPLRAGRSWFSFLLDAESTQEPKCGLKEYGY
jgi:hypothetical protein